MSDTPLVSVEKSGRAWHLTLQGYTEADAVGGYLWPEGVPAGVHIVPLVVVEEPAQMGKFELTGLTFDAIQSMEQSIARRIAQEGVITTGQSDTSDPQSPSEPDSTDDMSQKQPINDQGSEVSKSTPAEYVHLALESTEAIGTVAEVVEIFAPAEEALAVIPGIGHLATVVITTWEIFRAFRTGTRLQKEEGFCYGLMWETLGLPNGEKKFVDWAPDSADDLREAFFDGVAKGREQAQDVKVHNAIMLDIGYYTAHGPGSDASIPMKAMYATNRVQAAQELVLNNFWKQFREDEGVGPGWLDWPKPQDMHPYPGLDR